MAAVVFVCPIARLISGVHFIGIYTLGRFNCWFYGSFSGDISFPMASCS